MIISVLFGAVWRSAGIFKQVTTNAFVRFGTVSRSARIFKRDRVTTNALFVFGVIRDCIEMCEDFQTRFMTVLFVSVLFGAVSRSARIFKRDS